MKFFASLFIFASLLSCADDRAPVSEVVGTKAGSGERSSGGSTADDSDDQEPMQTDAKFDVEVKDVDAQVKAFREKVKTLKGRIVSEKIEGYEQGLETARFRIRVKRKRFDEMLDFIRSLGKLTHQQVTRTSLREGFSKDVDEETRYGEKKPKKRTKGATEAEIELLISREFNHSPTAHSLVGVQYSNLQFGDRINGHNSRYGGGLSFSHPERYVSLELSAFKSYEGEGSSTLATVGFSSFSSLLGNGKNTFLNPVLGVRLGILGIDNVVSWVLGLEMSLELVKYHNIVLDGFAHPYAIFGKDRSGNVIESGVRFYYPF